MNHGSEQKFLDTRDPAVLEEGGGRIVLFRPFIPAEAVQEVTDTLQSRWVGQGPRVDRFEQLFPQAIGADSAAVAVGSGTDALHLAYILAGVGPGDEVVTPVFTCTATNLPLIYLGARPRFADIEPDTLNIDVEHVRQLVNERTKAIVCVHYGGLPCHLDALHEIAREYGIPVIEDAAQAIGGTYGGKPIGGLSDYTVFSFQAIKHITTGDGGMLMLRDAERCAAAKRIRWFGIDREAKFFGHWENDIREVGYKYQMTDIAAAMGLAALPHLAEIVELRRGLLKEYSRRLRDVPGIKLLGEPETAECTHAAWLCTVAVENRKGLESKLREAGIESAQVHFRNDRYTVFADYREGALPHMDAMEDRYQVLPLHPQVTVADVERICDVISAGW
ncbi:MAG: DegT/DnrJ/EryC1/StrS family aminotransferase [Planctomycetales bacterium]|nr:DegT/DnrJ/EryC1/StrS family aminotransferase [Planctomycetales bacterium]